MTASIACAKITAVFPMRSQPAGTIRLARIVSAAREARILSKSVVMLEEAGRERRTWGV
jgi:hypothetical protein